VELGNSVPQFCDGKVVFLTNPNGEKQKSCDNEKYASACKKSDNQKNNNRPPEWKPLRQVYENISQTNWEADTHETGNDQKNQYLDGLRNPFVYPFIGLRFFLPKRIDRFLVHLGQPSPWRASLCASFQNTRSDWLALAIELSAGTAKQDDEFPSPQGPAPWRGHRLTNQAEYCTTAKSAGLSVAQGHQRHFKRKQRTSGSPLIPDMSLPRTLGGNLDGIRGLL
jgi:hypothetical protein